MVNIDTVGWKAVHVCNSVRLGHIYGKRTSAFHARDWKGTKCRCWKSEDSVENAGDTQQDRQRRGKEKHFRLKCLHRKCKLFLQLFWASAAFCFTNLDRSLSPVHLHPCDTILAPLHPGSCGLRCCFHLARRVSLLVLVRMWINTLMLPHLSPEGLESSISKRNAISTLHKGNVAPPLCYWCSHSRCTTGVLLRLTLTVHCWCTHLWCTAGSHTLSALLLCYWYTHTPLVSYWFISVPLMCDWWCIFSIVTLFMLTCLLGALLMHYGACTLIGALLVHYWCLHTQWVHLMNCMHFYSLMRFSLCH